MFNKLKKFFSTITGDNTDLIVTNIIDDKLYSTINAELIYKYWDEHYDYWGDRDYEYCYLYKSKKGQYFKVVNDKIILLSTTDVKNILAKHNEISIYEKEFGYTIG